jgi:2-polyprenyl-3-methyl-5-hydroxy-6-metoxy-1,4-benzoquinol methylase
MKYILKSEARTPTITSQKRIQEAILKVKPDVEELLSWYQNYSENCAFRLAFDIDYLVKYLPYGVSVLDVGSIPPIFPVAITALGYNVHGVDIAPERFQSLISVNNLDIKKVNVETEKLPFPDNTFDAVVLNEVFEHLRINPIHTLSEILRVLKPQGILFLSTVNLTSLTGWKNLILQNKLPDDLYTEYSKIKKLGHMGHVRVYTPDEVTVFLSKIGLDAEIVVYRGHDGSALTLRKLFVNAIYFLFPRLRPYFSVIARKRSVS